jgi:hypothetical protein
MLKILLAGAVAVPIAGAGVVAGTGVAWVDVKEGGANGTRIVLPVPLVLAQTAAAFVPVHKAKVEMGRAKEYLPLARRVVEALADGPDGELVRVEEKDELVVITKVKGMLEIRVSDNGEEVAVNVPLEMALALIQEDGDISPFAAVGALRHARFTELVNVKSHGGDEVKISIW